jgi:hypothetical protein
MMYQTFSLDLRSSLTTRASCLIKVNYLIFTFALLPFYNESLTPIIYYLASLYSFMMFASVLITNVRAVSSIPSKL